MSLSRSPIKWESLGKKWFGWKLKELFLWPKMRFGRGTFSTFWSKTLLHWHHKLWLECGATSDPSTADLGCTGRHSFWQWWCMPSSGFLTEVGMGVGCWTVSNIPGHWKNMLVKGNIATDYCPVKCKEQQAHQIWVIAINKNNSFVSLGWWHQGKLGLNLPKGHIGTV